MIGEGVILNGGCLCGAIRYRLTGPSRYVMQCCCRDCQKATGTGHTTIIGVHRDQLELDGSPATYTNYGDTGGEVTRHFCGNCGGRLYTSGTLPGDNVIVQAGSLDEPSMIAPQAVIYVKDAAAWDHFDPALPRHDTTPPRSGGTVSPERSASGAGAG